MTFLIILIWYTIHLNATAEVYKKEYNHLLVKNDSLIEENDMLWEKLDDSEDVNREYEFIIHGMRIKHRKEVEKLENEIYN